MSDNVHQMNRILTLSAQFIVALSFMNPASAEYSPYVDRDYPTNIYWGDTHAHTNISTDAVFTSDQDEAYRFARGEEVISISGQPVRLQVPLDFLVLAEHGKNMGTQWARNMSTSDPVFRRSPIGKLWAAVQEELLDTPGVNAERVLNGRHWPRTPADLAITRPDFRRLIWEYVTMNADRHNQPGKFTTLIGYEYTPFTPAIHRVVIFRDDAATVNRVLPLTAFESERPEDLWTFLADYEQTTGGAALAIPHNSNLTGGAMFNILDSDGKPFTRDYALSRSRWEPLSEATQIKGDSETHAVVSPDDEFADFETWNGWSGRQNGGVDSRGRNLKARPDSLVQYEYLRPALKLGLQQQALTGANPFKFGMIGSTDNHMVLPGSVDENNFWGYTPSPSRVSGPFSTVNWEMNAAGLAAVWARENTREAIFDAMKRREVYASTGPRITLRFFGGWDFETEDALRPDLAEVGYTGGVPMGADLSRGPIGKSPRFLISAAKDPNGAHLDRVQVVKGWLDAGGVVHEKIFNVALSDERTVAANGHVEPVGNTVDVRNASYTNSIGDPELLTVWEDPEFDHNELAFYYLRVLEIPTPRWTAYDAKFYVAKLYSLESMPEVPVITQERAYSSPIWYTP